MPVLAMMIIGEIMLRRIPNEYKAKKAYLDNNAANIRILCLGNSHSFYNIDPQYFSLPAFNAGNSSQTLDYDWLIFNKYKDKLQQLRYVLMPISYSTLYEKLDAGIESWRVKNYTLYYQVSNTHNPEYYSELLNSSTRINLQKLYDYYLHGKYQNNITPLGFANDYSSKVQNDIEKLSAMAAERNTKTSDRFLKENIGYLEKIIETVKEKKATLVFFTSPVYHTYYDKMNKEQLNKTQDEINALINKYPGIIYKNFINDSSFTRADFYDGDHMNEIGAEKFTKKLDLIIAAADSLKK